MPRPPLLIGLLLLSGCAQSDVVLTPTNIADDLPCSRKLCYMIMKEESSKTITIFIDPETANGYTLRFEGALIGSGTSLHRPLLH